MQNQELFRNRVEADLSRMQHKLNQLMAMAEDADGRDQSRFTRYVERIERKREEISRRLDDLSARGVEVKLDIENGLRDAWDRISIASEAAKARFH